jgi:hypothetical protein
MKITKEIASRGPAAPWQPFSARKSLCYKGLQNAATLSCAREMPEKQEIPRRLRRLT